MERTPNFNLMVDTLEPVSPELRRLVVELEQWRAPLDLDAITAGRFDRLWGRLIWDAEAASQDKDAQTPNLPARGGEGKPWYSVNPGKGTRDVTSADVANLRAWWKDRVLPREFVTDIGDRLDTASAYQLLLDSLSTFEAGQAETKEKAKRQLIKLAYNETEVWLAENPKNKIKLKPHNASGERAANLAERRLKFLQLFAGNPALHAQANQLWEQLSVEPLLNKSPLLGLADWTDKFMIADQPIFEHSETMSKQDSFFRLNPAFRISLIREGGEPQAESFPESNLPLKFNFKPEELYEAAAYFLDSRIKDKLVEVGLTPVSVEAVEPLEGFRKRQGQMVMSDNEVAVQARQAERLRVREKAAKKLVNLIGETSKFVDFLKNFDPAPEDPEYLFWMWLEKFRISYERDLLRRAFPDWMPELWVPKTRDRE